MPRKKQTPNEIEEGRTKVSATRESKVRLIKKSTKKALPSDVNIGATRVNAENSVPSSSPPSEALQARVANRAYELYWRRGGRHGQDLDDWVLAERQVLLEEL